MKLGTLFVLFLGLFLFIHIHSLVSILMTGHLTLIMPLIVSLIGTIIMFAITKPLVKLGVFEKELYLFSGGIGK